MIFFYSAIMQLSAAMFATNRQQLLHKRPRLGLLYFANYCICFIIEFDFFICFGVCCS